MVRTSACHAGDASSILAWTVASQRERLIVLLNYKDALNASITDKLTKSQLIEIANTLQDRCLLSELDKPELIPLNSYIKDAQSRWDIHTIETKALAKDIHSIGKQARVIYDQAYARAFDN